MCLNYMTDKLFIVYLIILFIIIISIYINKNCKETFSGDSESLGNMFNELEEWEKKCNAIEEKYQIKNDIEKIKQNEIAFNQLEELDKKIYELKEIVKDLNIEKKRRDGINEKCQANAQIKLNQNYDIVNDLNKKGLVNQQDIKLNFNISDALKFNNLNKNKENIVTKEKCNIKNSKDHVNLSKTNPGDKILGCDGNKLKEQSSLLNNNFQ